MSDKDTPKTSRVADERRAEILKAAGTCFARRGFHQTSMAEICAEAKMSPGSVYRYFRSKEEIIATQAELDREESRQIFEQAKQQPTLYDAMYFLITGFDDWYCDSEAMALYMETIAEAARNPLVNQMVQQTDQIIVGAMADLFATAQERGEMDGSLDPVVTAQLLMAIYDGLVVRRTYDPYPIDRFTQTMLTLTCRFLQMKPTETATDESFVVSPIPGIDTLTPV